MMASSKRRTPVVSVDCRQTLTKIRRAVGTGTADKLFEDEIFISEFLQVVREDTVDITVKTECLSVLEQHGQYLHAGSISEVLSAIQSALRVHCSRTESLRLSVQLMLTTTTLLIDLELLKSGYCTSLVSVLWDLVCQVNDVASRRLRSCACQCLRQLEIWSPGLLSRHKDKLLQIVREERTDIFQDYASLLSTVLSNITQPAASSNTSQKSSINAEEVVPPLSYLMENAFKLTPAGLWPVVQSMLQMVKSTDHVSSSIFKPLMLQNMATFDPCLLHTILYIQTELRGEILSEEEEIQLLQRLASSVNTLSLHPALRLLLLQWIKGYLQVIEDHCESKVSYCKMVSVLRRHLRPLVFDSLDIHVDKLTILTQSYSLDSDHSLTDNVYYLKRLALTTGNELATVGLYRVLFAAFIHHRTQQVADAVLKITQELVVDYPHLIPLILDFLGAVKDTIGEGSVYKDTLSSLHNQVLNSGQADVLAHFTFYLQVLGVSARQPEIPQRKTVRFLLSLVRYAEQRGLCDWGFGNAVLAICRSLLLHHSTHLLHYDLGELLFEMMSCFTDSAVRSRATLLYTLLASASDEKIREVLGTPLLGGAVLSQNITSILSGTMNEKSRTKIVTVEDANLQLKRMSVSPLFSLVESAPATDIKYTDLSGRLAAYYSHLSCLQTELVYQLQISLEASAEYEMISGISIKLKSETEAFNEVKDIHLLSLSKLSSQNVQVKLTPKLPKPAVFNVRAMFFGDSHTTVSCPLQPLEVTFSDLTLPLPWQQVGLQDVRERQLVFDELWQRFTDTSPGNSGHGVESVKVLKCSANKLHKSLEAFQLTPGKDGSGSNKFMIFLPPTYHLLLRLCSQGENQVVSMATDYWKLLPTISNYFNLLCGEA